MEFKVIETQEQLDAVIGERLKRERDNVQKELAGKGWLSPEAVQKAMQEQSDKIKALEEAAAATQQTLADKDAAIAEGAKYRADLEKTRIALAAGLKMEYADRLRGDSAEEWKKDAEALAKDFAAAHVTAPLGNPEPVKTEGPDVAKKFAAWMEETMND